MENPTSIEVDFCLSHGEKDAPTSRGIFDHAKEARPHGRSSGRTAEASLEASNNSAGLQNQLGSCQRSHKASWITLAGRALLVSSV